MTEMENYASDAENQWCPGCPNFSILKAYKMAFTELKILPHEICMVSGIGQAAKLPHYLACNFFNGLHGRAVPVATAVKVANPDLTTIVATGDGDCYGEGGNHFLHALRRNPDITVVVHNNEIYALTKGQASPTTPYGEKRSLQARGVEIPPLNMPAVAILHGCTFVARGFAVDVDHLKEILVRAILHKGLSFVDIIQPCITWGTRSVGWYKKRVFKLGREYDRSNQREGLNTSMAGGEKIPIGVLYQADEQPAFADSFRQATGNKPLAELEPPSVKTIEAILSEFNTSRK